MDALIFLSIVGIVFVFIVGYSMTYGSSIVDSTIKLYNSTYHYSALKAFMSASYGRDGKDILYSQAQDNVVTMIKEDYGTNSLKNLDDSDSSELDKQKRLLSKETKLAVFGVLEDLFRILPQRSYLLLITHDPNQGVLQPLILFIHTYSNEQYVSYVCYPLTNDVIEPYLRQHTLDLEVAEGNFIIYRNILSKEDPGTTKGMTKENGSIFLASWISNEETIDLTSQEYGLNCELKQALS